MNETEITEAVDIIYNLDTGTAEAATTDTVVAAESAPADNTLTYPQTLFLGIGVFLTLLLLYFIVQRGSY